MTAASLRPEGFASVIVSNSEPVTVIAVMPSAAIFAIPVITSLLLVLVTAPTITEVAVEIFARSEAACASLSVKVCPAATVIVNPFT